MSEHPFAVVAPPHTPPISVSNTTTEVTRTGSWKYIRPVYHDRVAPCIAACPTGVDIEGYMTMLRDGSIDGACDLLLRENPMPAITGRICDHPCELDCNRASFDGAVAVHAVERMLGDRILKSPLPVPVKPTKAEKIAVIGSGPAGLACAYHLTRFGYPVEVFEQEDEPGGVLRTGIPEYRLPRSIVDAQIERYRMMGVRIHCGFKVGEDTPWSTLTSDFAALFVATGAQASRDLGITVPSDRAVWNGLSFLRVVNRGERPNIGKHVAVIGGGNTAMDCARTAIRLGAEVTVVYRRTREEMPAIAEEVADAESEGVEFMFLAAPQRMLQSNGRFTLICKRMRLGEPDADGRRVPVETNEPSFPLEVDTILTAIGENADLQALPTELRTPAAVAPDEWGASRVQNIFVGGDMAGTNRTVASALGAGKRAAIGIDRYLRACRGATFDEELIDEVTIAGIGSMSAARWTHDDPVARVEPLNDVVEFEDINTSSFATVPRHTDRRARTTLPFSETNIGLTEAHAVSEAGRCFQCGVCTACELCLIYCGDAAITRTSDGRFEIDMDHCKGCGICAVECPRGAIQMTREGL